MQRILLAMMVNTIYGMIGALFLSSTRVSVPLRRRMLPWYFFGGAVLFLSFVALLGFGWGAIAATAAFQIVITLLNLSQIRICSTCGRTSWGDRPFAAALHCPRCGAKLDDESSY